MFAMASPIQIMMQNRIFRPGPRGLHGPVKLIATRLWPIVCNARSLVQAGPAIMRPANTFPSVDLCTRPGDKVENGLCYTYYLSSRCNCAYRTVNRRASCHTPTSLLT